MKHAMPLRARRQAVTRRDGYTGHEPSRARGWADQSPRRLGAGRAYETKRCCGPANSFAAFGRVSGRAAPTPDRSEQSPSNQLARTAVAFGNRRAKSDSRSMHAATPCHGLPVNGRTTQPTGLTAVLEAPPQRALLHDPHRTVRPGAFAEDDWNEPCVLRAPHSARDPRRSFAKRIAHHDQRDCREDQQCRQNETHEVDPGCREHLTPPGARFQRLTLTVQGPCRLPRVAIAVVNRQRLADSGNALLDGRNRLDLSIAWPRWSPGADESSRA